MDCTIIFQIAKSVGPEPKPDYAWSNRRHQGSHNIAKREPQGIQEGYEEQSFRIEFQNVQVKYQGK